MARSALTECGFSGAGQPECLRLAAAPPVHSVFERASQVPDRYLENEDETRLIGHADDRPRQIPDAVIALPALRIGRLEHMAFAVIPVTASISFVRIPGPDRYLKSASRDMSDVIEHEGKHE